MVEQLYSFSSTYLFVLSFIFFYGTAIDITKNLILKEKFGILLKVILIVFLWSIYVTLTIVALYKFFLVLE